MSELEDWKEWNEIYQRINGAMIGLEVRVDILVGVLAAFTAGAIDSQEGEMRDRLRNMFIEYVLTDLGERDAERVKH